MLLLAEMVWLIVSVETPAIVLLGSRLQLFDAEIYRNTCGLEKMDKMRSQDQPEKEMTFVR